MSTTKQIVVSSHHSFKSYDFAEALCNGVSWDALGEFSAYLAAGGDINERDRTGDTALSIAREVATGRGWTSDQRAFAKTLEAWLLKRGAEDGSE